jgi:hypothetical protein
MIIGLFVVLALVVAQWLGGTLSVVAIAQEPEGEPEIPFLEDWMGSGHADADAEAFVHWDEDDPAVVPIACAKCHSTPGHLDFLGADGSTPGEVDEDAPIGTVITCVACHNDVTITKDSVVMPSGIEITGLGDEARCMECHQGRHSTISVTEAISQAGVTDDDAVSEDLGFLNIHYYPAAATKYGTLAKGGHEYDGKTYDAFFAHVDGFESCIGCHNQHTLELQVEACQECHSGVTSAEDFKDVRMAGSLVDYDGDGDMEEGVFYELEGLREILYRAIQMYAAEVAGTPIVYDVASYPYWFTDEEEGYRAWTPRLLKAAYNYQMATKDPGAYAHGGKYILQLLYDSIEDLDAALVEGLQRIDHGHFAGSEEAFRHWDEDGEVPGSCAKCHSAGGLPTFLKEGATVSEPLANGFQCSTCHDDVSTFTRFVVDEVEFPSGAVLSFGEGVDANLCLQCHQGRESTVSVNELIQGLDNDEVSDALRFLNIHYFAAGATKFGTEAKGAYEYDGKEYVGFFKHVPGLVTCGDCHSTHQLGAKVEECGKCHAYVEGEEDLGFIGIGGPDYDGDGARDEGTRGEIETMREALYQAIQAYAAEVAEAEAIVYDPGSYPYFFIDTDGDGEVDKEEVAFPNQYNTWTPRLLRAAYNYQYATKDPGAFAHNGKYIIQTLYDTLEDIGVDMSGMERPE